MGSSGRRILCVFSIALIACPAAAQIPDTSRHHEGTTITGVVRDSIGGAPLADATVQLVAADRGRRFGRTTISDSLGRFQLDGVPAGRYSLGFFHPILESLGIEPPLRELFVLGRGEVRSDLATPSPERFREAVCGSSSQSGAVVVGVLRDARDLSTVAGVSVTGEWLELTITRRAMVSKLPHLVATTAENGWFAMCNVPSPGTITLRAVRNADSTDLIEVEVPAEGVVVQELLLGFAPVDPSSSTTLRTDDGRLRGTVISSEGGQPVAGARIGMVAGPQTRSNERGEWSLAGAPIGTRMLEVRAVGYYPVRRAVNVVPGSVPSLRFALSTLKAVLDTIKVSASRVRFPGSGFEDRRRTGAGRYLTPENIARSGVLATSDIFRTMPGISFNISENGLTKQFRMRGAFGSCEPLIFVDGLRMPGLTAADIDAFFSPKEVAGIEIYSEASVPAQFKDYAKRDPCGAIVIWRKWLK